MYEDYEDDEAMDIIEERERELKERKREKALKRKEAESQISNAGDGKKSSQRGRPRTKKQESDDDQADESDDEPAMSFGADSTSANQRRKKQRPSESAEDAAQLAEGDDAATTAKMEAAMKKAVAAQKPKRKLPKMDVERLLTDKGLPKLLEMAERFKVNEKASTLEKLNQLMALYEVWTHVMFPSMAFSDVVRRIETLGTKRPVQSFLRKLRLGDNPGPWDIHVNPSDDENMPENGQMTGGTNDDPFFEAEHDNFDDFLSQALDQIEDAGKKKASSRATPDEDLEDLDAFLDNLQKPIRDELL